MTDPTKKNRPTRTRKEAEAANLRPLVPKDRKEAKRRAKEKRDELFQKQQIALQTGDERWLPARDKGRVRRYVRDSLDARWSFSEFLLPGMLIFLAAMIAFTFVPVPVDVQGLGIFAITMSFYLMLLISIIEGVIVWQKLKRRIAKKYPDDPIPKGTWFYAYARIMMARRWRSPKPQVERGEFPDGPKKK